MKQFCLNFPKKPIGLIGAGTFFLISLAAYLYFANMLRSGPDFNDETEKLVGIMMMAKGLRLYRDIFSHHGPLAFMMIQWVYALTGERDVAMMRCAPILLSFLSIGALLFGPAIRGMAARLVVAGAMCLGLLSLQSIFPLTMGLYQNYVGHLLFCALALFAIPALSGNRVSRISAFLGGMAAGLAFFGAYSYVLSLFFMFGAVFYKALIVKDKPNPVLLWLLFAICGAVASAAITLGWLLCFGDVLGYFVYHFYFNQVIYTQFFDFNPFSVLLLTIPGLNYIHLHDTYPFSWLWMVCLVWSSILFYGAVLGRVLQIKTGAGLLNTALIAAGVMLTVIYSNPRGLGDFQCGTATIMMLGLIPLICALVLQYRPFPKKLAALVLLLTGGMISAVIAAQFLSTTQLYNVSPAAYYNIKPALRMTGEKESVFIRELTTPEEGILSLPLEPSLYLRSDRLPVSGNYYYLPWQGAYLKKPVPGYKIDLCADIETRKPKIIYLDNRSWIWGIDPATYLDCIQGELEAHYLRTTVKQDLWVRADSVAANKSALDAAIVPKGYNADWLPKELRDRINAKKPR